jgi:hypothetical protein
LGEISDRTLGTVRKRLHGFVYALLTATHTALEAIDSESKKGKITKAKDVELRQAKLADAFRDRMTEGQSYQGPNAYRKGFYEKVTQLADEVSFRELPRFGEDDIFSKVRGRQSTNQ